MPERGRETIRGPEEEFYRGPEKKRRLVGLPETREEGAVLEGPIAVPTLPDVTKLGQREGVPTMSKMLRQGETERPQTPEQMLEGIEDIGELEAALVRVFEKKEKN